MRRVALDIKVLFDVFLRRSPDDAASAEVFRSSEQKGLTGIVCAFSFPVLHYLLSRELSARETRNALILVRGVFTVAPVDAILDQALASSFTDFEDAIQYYSALAANADCLLTRNKRDFKATELPVFSPEEFVALIR